MATIIEGDINKRFSTFLEGLLLLDLDDIKVDSTRKFNKSVGKHALFQVQVFLSLPYLILKAREYLCSDTQNIVVFRPSLS